MECKNDALVLQIKDVATSSTWIFQNVFEDHSDLSVWFLWKCNQYDMKRWLM